MRIAEQQIRWTSNKNCIKFVRRTNQKDYVNIVNKPGCSSFIGLIGNKQDVNLGPGCLYYAAVIHEVYHALGVFFFYYNKILIAFLFIYSFLLNIGIEHEQNRPDRDDWIEINVENIKTGNYNCNRSI